MATRTYTYQQVTDAAEKRIRGLIERSHMTIDRDSIRLNREWAYGAYLLWSSLTIGWQEDGDDDRLRNLALDRESGRGD